MGKVVLFVILSLFFEGYGSYWYGLFLSLQPNLSFGVILSPLLASIDANSLQCVELLLKVKKVIYVMKPFWFLLLQSLIYCSQILDSSHIFLSFLSFAVPYSKIFITNFQILAILAKFCVTLFYQILGQEFIMTSSLNEIISTSLPRVPMRRLLLLVSVRFGVFVPQL